MDVYATIVEDDKKAAEQMAEHLRRYAEETGEPIDTSIFYTALSFLDGYPATYDVVFMDIELPDLNGIEAARRLRGMDESVFLIFVTNMAKYAINGYEVNALDYFLKPVFYSDLKLRMERIRKAKSLDAYSFTLPVQGGAYRFSADQVLYIESSGHTLTFHTLEGLYTMRGPSMRELELQLSPHGFARCNTCYIVNLRYCKSVDGATVNVNGEPLQISRSGRMAANVIRGAKSRGVYTYVKHFAVNDQETHRDANGLVTWLSEQALREIYLRPFEMAVKEGGSNAMMSSFNRLGAVWAGGCYELLTDVLRGEWGFQGMVVTDYNTNAYMYPDQMIRAGGDVNLMQDKQPSASGDIVTASHQTAIRKAAKNILFTVVNSNAMNGMGEGITYRYAMPPWQAFMYTVDALAAAALILWGVFSVRKGRKKELAECCPA